MDPQEPLANESRATSEASKSQELVYWSACFRSIVHWPQPTLPYYAEQYKSVGLRRNTGVACILQLLPMFQLCFGQTPFFRSQVSPHPTFSFLHCRALCVCLSLAVADDDFASDERLCKSSSHLLHNVSKPDLQGTTLLNRTFQATGREQTPFWVWTPHLRRPGRGRMVVSP